MNDITDQALVDVIRANTARSPGTPAVIEPDQRVTWREYDLRSDAIASALLGFGLARGERAAVLLVDGSDVHAALLGCEKAGLVAVGIGPRAGDRELRHLLAKTGARCLVTTTLHRGRSTVELVAALRDSGVVLDHHLLLDEPLPSGPEGDALTRLIETHRMRPDELFLVNSTSGTTGLPKCVMHTQRRWMYFHQLAVEAGDLGPDDVVLSAIPAPFGFGLWTSHFTPALLGAPVVVLPEFSPTLALELVERERVTVLACVSTQFVMLLNAPGLDTHDLSSLRCMFTGGEAVSYQRAAQFEERTGALVLQFYGSNETGALSRTTVSDDRERRLRTAGRVIDDMHVRLFDEQGNDVTERGRGQPGCRGPATAIGYLDDDEANARLFTDDGWMLVGDVVEIDREGYLTVVGRAADFIIRGGKNISAFAVEEEVASHPAVALAAAVAMPDERYGERVCCFVELRPGYRLTLEELRAHLHARGVGKELWPERLEVVDELPRGSGGKVAKAALHEEISRRLATEANQGVHT